MSNATAYTVTIANNTTVCRDVTIAGPATGNLTLAGAGDWFVYGSLTLPATGFTRSFLSRIHFYGDGSHTITTNGVTLTSPLVFAGTGTYTLQDALNNGTSAVTLNAGVFNTDGKNLTCGLINASAGTTAGTLTLGASTVSATNISANAPLTINAGTSNITLSQTGASIGAGTNYTGNTFNNVTFSSTAITTANFYGNNTFNNLTFAAKSTATVSRINLFGDQTVTGTLTVAGQLSVRRYFIQSNIIGTTRTLTVGTVASLVDVDFRDITVAGASSPWSGTQLGNCGGNTNITFPAAKTVYWNATTGGAWTGNFWATSSGGVVNVANFPLAQDTAIIDNTGLNTGTSITGFSSYNLGTLTSTKTNAYTLAGASPILYGNLTLTAATTVSAFSPIFAGRVTQDFTSGGNTINVLDCSGVGASVRLVSNTTVTVWRLTSGGLNTNNRSFTVTTLSVVGLGLPFTLTLGSSAVSIPNLGSSSASAPVMTVNAGTSTITATLAGSVFGFEGQTLTWNNVIFSVAGGKNIYGTNTFNNLTLPAATATTVSTTSIRGDITVTGTLAFGGGTSATQRLGVVSNIPGTQRTLTAATVTGLSDIDFRDIAAAGASAPWSGTRLGDCQGNSGITFVAGTNKYWNLAGTNNWSDTAWATSSGGTPAVNNFPLAQDTCIFDNTGSAGTVTLNAGWNIGNLSMSGRTTAMTLAGTNTTVSIYGDVSYGSGITSTFSGTWTFRNPSTQTFSTAGVLLAHALTIDNPSCVFQHSDAYTSTTTNNAAILVTRGSYSTQSFSITVPGLISSNSNTRSITFGTSTVTLTGALNVLFMTNTTGLTFSSESSTINLPSTFNNVFDGGGQTFGTVSAAGTLSISGNNTFGTLANSAGTALIFTRGTTQTVTNFTYTGDVSNVVRWYTSIPGQRATLKQSATGGSLAAVGTNSVDGGNNSGLTFTGTSPDYFYVKDIAYSANYNGGPNFFMFF
jgi:hypothetical protein